MLSKNLFIFVILILGHIHMNDTYYFPMQLGRPQALQLYLIRMRNHHNLLR